MSLLQHLLRASGWAVVAVCLAGSPVAALAAPPVYVRLATWASEQGLKVAWAKRDETLVLTGASTRIVLTMDSRQTVINGVRVWLIHPVTKRDGWVHLAKTDAQDTFEPLLHARQQTSNIRTILIDPGHGGKDPGFHSGGREEKDYTLLLAKEVQAQLAKKKFKALLTRSSDTYIDVYDRSDLARRKGADLFISLHFNSAGNSTKGTETYCLTPAGSQSTNTRGDIGETGPFPGNRNNSSNMLLAYYIQREIVNKLGTEDRGVQRSRFAVLREATMPAVLIESGFMSNPLEAKKIYSADYRKRISAAIASGVLAYKEATEPARKK